MLGNYFKSGVKRVAAAVVDNNEYPGARFTTMDVRKIFEHKENIYQSY